MLYIVQYMVHGMGGGGDGGGIDLGGPTCADGRDGLLGQGRKRRNLDRNRSAEVTGHNSTAAHVAANPGTGQPGGRY